MTLDVIYCPACRKYQHYTKRKSKDGRYITVCCKGCEHILQMEPTEMPKPVEFIRTLKYPHKNSKSNRECWETVCPLCGEELARGEMIRDKDINRYMCPKCNRGMTRTQRGYGRALYKLKHWDEFKEKDGEYLPYYLERAYCIPWAKGIIEEFKEKRMIK